METPEFITRPGRPSDPPGSVVVTRGFSPRKAHLVVVECVYHQPGDDKATGVDNKYSVHLDTEEQVYQRKTKVGEDWASLDCGWLHKASVLILSNDERLPVHVQPTPREREEVAGRVIEVACGQSSPAVEKSRTMHSPPQQQAEYVPFAVVSPGTSLRFQPHDLSTLKVRCRTGTARFTVTLMPT